MNIRRNLRIGMALSLLAGPLGAGCMDPATPTQNGAVDGTGNGAGGPGTAGSGTSSNPGAGARTGPGDTGAIGGGASTPR